MLKSYGWGGGVVGWGGGPCDFSVSPWSKSFFFFFFGGTFIQLGGLLGQGLGLGPGLDNSCNSCSFHSYKHVLKSLLSSIALQHIDY